MLVCQLNCIHSSCFCRCADRIIKKPLSAVMFVSVMGAANALSDRYAARRKLCGAMKPEARIQLPRGFGAFHPMRNSSAVPSCSGTCARTSDLGYGLFPSDAFPKIFIFSALYSRAPPRSFCRTPRLCPPGKFLRLSAKAEDSRRCFRARREPYASRALR